MISTVSNKVRVARPTANESRSSGQPVINNGAAAGPSTMKQIERSLTSVTATGNPAPVAIVVPIAARNSHSSGPRQATPPSVAPIFFGNLTPSSVSSDLPCRARNEKRDIGGARVIVTPLAMKGAVGTGSVRVSISDIQLCAFRIIKDHAADLGCVRCARHRDVERLAHPPLPACNQRQRNRAAQCFAPIG